MQITYARREQLPESGERPEEKNVVTTAKPPQAIPGGLPGPGLAAQVIVSKACDHIPFATIAAATRRTEHRNHRGLLLSMDVSPAAAGEHPMGSKASTSFYMMQTPERQS